MLRMLWDISHEKIWLRNKRLLLSVNSCTSIQGVRKKGYLVKKPLKVLRISMQILKFLRFSILNKLIVVSIYITIQTLVMAFNEVAFFPGHPVVVHLGM